MEKENRVQWVYASRDNQELAERYDQWAEDYDGDLERDFEYKLPQMTTEVVMQYVPREARILDAGAGTGLMGEMLAKQGYKNIVAMDLSQGMLDEARKKNVYLEFHRMVMGEILGFETDTFDAVVSVGVLTVGHAPAGSLDELVRVTKPGGYIVFSLRPDVYRDSGFQEKQTALEQAGKWKLVTVSGEFQALPKGEPDVYHQIWLYQVMS